MQCSFLVVTLQFDPTSYQVNEDDGNARLSIVKQGRINRDIVFTFETQDGTASSASKQFGTPFYVIVEHDQDTIFHYILIN